jgi:hypothetical protein
MGKTCNTCPTGYYGLSAPHPEGCLKCQCSSKTTSCSTAQGWFKDELKSEFLTTQNNINMSGWIVVNSGGQVVTTARWDWNPDFASSLSPRLEK